MIQRLSKASPFIQVLTAIGSFLASSIVFWILVNNLLFTAAVMATIAIHELCHLIAFRRYGIKSGIVFFAIAAVTYPINLQEDQNPVELFTKTFWVHPAGIIGNLALGILGLFLGSISSFWYLFSWINFILALFNLAPASAFDGGKIVNTVTYLFAQEREEKAVWLITVTEAVAIFGTMQLMNTGVISEFIGIILVFFFGVDMLTKLFTNQHKGKLSPTEGGLSKQEAAKWAMVYFFLVSASIIGLLFQLAWLSSMVIAR